MTLTVGGQLPAPHHKDLPINHL